MKRVGKTLLVIACVIGIAVGGIRLVMDRQVGKMYAQLDAVAVAAPATPMSRAKIKMGSSTMLITAPMTVVSMLIRAKPWVVMKGFIPMTSRTNTAPRI